MGQEHTSSYAREHQLQGDLLSFDLEGEVDDLRRQLSATSQDRIAKTLVKEGPIRLTLIAMKQGATIAEHHAPGPCTLHFISGKAVFTGGGQGDTVEAGRVLAFDTRVAHSLTAETDSAFLLTIAMTPGSQ